MQALERPGGVVLLPTETVYGFSGRAGDPVAARRIAAIKGRELQPMVVLVDALPPGVPPLARELGAVFWPGPVSIVVPAPSWVAPEVRGPGDTVAVRVSPLPPLAALVARVGPITSTSANRHGRPPPREPGSAPPGADAVLDLGLLPPAAPSTLVDGRTGRLLRRGAWADRVEAWLRRRAS